MVVLDAAGTLLDVKGSVGEAYAADARAVGAELDPEAIEAGFGRAMAAAPPLAFGELPPDRRRMAERSWWRSVARRALESAGAVPETFPFERFFDLAWERFARPPSWRLHLDVRPGLRALRRDGVPLAVFSNWDGRLPALLDGLGIGGYFAAVVVSSRLATAKPDPRAFAEAAAAAEEIEGSAMPIMVGDRVDHDVAPALDAGWKAVWLDREERAEALPRGAERIADLRELPAIVGRWREAA